MSIYKKLFTRQINFDLIFFIIKFAYQNKNKTKIKLKTNKMKFKLALLSAMFFSGVAMAQPAEVTAKFNEAATMLGAGKVVEAIPVLEGVIKSGLAAGPEALDIVKQAQKLLPQCYYRKGGAAASAGNLDQALVDLTQAADMAELYGVPTVQSSALGMLAKVYMVDGGNAFNAKDYKKAIEVFSKATVKFPTNTEMALLLAKSYAESGDMPKATESYMNVIALEKTHSKYAEPAAKAKSELSTYMLIDASTAAKDNNLEGVVAATDAILSFDATNAIAHMLRLQTATNVKNFDAVIEYGDAAIAAQPAGVEKSNASFLVGAAYQNKENKAKAIELYKNVTEGPNAAIAKTQITALSK